MNSREKTKEICNQLMTAGCTQEKVIEIIIEQYVSVHTYPNGDGGYGVSFYNEFDELIFDVNSDYDDEEELKETFYDSLSDYYEEQLKM